MVRGDWRLVVGGGWRLVVGSGWRLVVVGGWWRLAVGGWWSLGAVLKGGPSQKKIGFLKDRIGSACMQQQDGLPNLVLALLTVLDRGSLMPA